MFLPFGGYVCSKIITAILLIFLSNLSYSSNIVVEDILNRMSHLAPNLELSKALNWSKLIYSESQRYRYNPYLMLAIIRQESNFRERIVSQTNDYGLCQINISWLNNSKFKEIFPKVKKNNLLEGETSIRIASWILYKVKSEKLDFDSLPYWVLFNSRNVKAQEIYRDNVIRHLPKEYDMEPLDMDNRGL